MLVGLVLGLAIYNAVLLDFPLPLALYRKLLGPAGRAARPAGHGPHARQVPAPAARLRRCAPSPFEHLYTLPLRSPV